MKRGGWMRLQKFIAHSGITSRRKAEELIKQGRVKVNNKIITEMGLEINPSLDRVYIDNEQISYENSLVYVMLNKPEGYVTTLSDEHGRPTVIDLIDDIPQRIYPVGRLDYDSSGLLILTNDGSLTYQLTHPKHEVVKTYIVTVKGIPEEKKLSRLRAGVDIGDYITAPASVEVIKKDRQYCCLAVKIHEGKNRQVRKMFDAVGHPVQRLKRIAVGEIKLDKLPRGKWRYLTEEEIGYLKTIS